MPDEKKDEKKDEQAGGNGSGIPLLHQYDPRWASHPYNWGTVASSGCGPTSFAMIARWYGIDISPADAVDFAATGYHTGDGTSYNFFSDAAAKWGFAMHQASRAEVEESLRKGYPCIAAHGNGMFTYNGHFIVYAKLTESGKLIVNDPNCGGGGPNNRGDDYQYDLAQVLDENEGSGFVGFVCDTPHDGKKSLMSDQSLQEHGSGSLGAIGVAKSSDGGFRITPRGTDTVHIVKLPDKKTFCEPIYPDYVTVSDTVPQWVLDQSVAQANADSAQANGTKIPDGDAKEKAPNGMHYYENDIKYLMENNKGMTREQAIEILSKDKKYTRKVKQEQDGTFTVVEENATNDSNNKKDSNESSAKSSGGKTSEEWNAEAEEHNKKSKHYVELAEQVKNEMRERYKAETGKSDVTNKELVDVWAKANASDLAKKYHDLYEKAMNEDKEVRRCQNEAIKALKLN